MYHSLVDIMMLHQDLRKIKFPWRRISQSEIRNSAAAEKNWNRKARAGKNSFPPTPFLFARPSDWILKFGIRIFVKESSNISQKTPPKFEYRILAVGARFELAMPFRTFWFSRPAPSTELSHPTNSRHYNKPTILGKAGHDHYRQRPMNTLSTLPF
ncbi:MAG: hypothetical protein UX65_C0002G0052 [Parcubacteria group bacterium GW2011_GWB1_46_8]|nr:MAG: hypothetical protein UX65_C0002G0052 [Parcubacteria group bacterium GW2011_GWB1_46_8]